MLRRLVWQKSTDVLMVLSVSVITEMTHRPDNGGSKHL
jgi:hypothetical protein